MSQLGSCPQCGYTSIPPKSSEEEIVLCPQCKLPQLIVAGKYRVEKKLCEGGCGILYLAKHIQLHTDPWRVLKFLKPEFFDHPSAAERFAREVEVTAALSQRNQHIVRVYDDFGELPQLGRYYVMEYLQGEDLHAYMQRQGDIPLDIIYHILKQLLAAMREAHQAGVIHRDLKPHNIFLLEQMGDPNFVKIIDFGIAKSQQVQENLQLTQNNIVGTPEYMAPEQCTGQQVDARTDIYSIGIILYELLTGRTPFLPPNAMGVSAMQMAIAQIMEEPKPPSEIRPERKYPPALEEAVMRALKKDPKNRFQNAEAFSHALAKSDPYIHTKSEEPGVLVAAFQEDSSFDMFGLDSDDETTKQPAPTGQFLYTEPIASLASTTPDPPESPESSAPTLPPDTPTIRRTPWRITMFFAGGLIVALLLLFTVPRWMNSSTQEVPKKQTTKTTTPPPSTPSPRPLVAPPRPTPPPRRVEEIPTPPRKKAVQVPPRSVKRIIRRRFFRKKRTIAMVPPKTSLCPPATSEVSWVALLAKPTPKDIRLITKTPWRRIKRGFCISKKPGSPIKRVTLKLAGYELCSFSIPASTDRLSTQLLPTNPEHRPHQLIQDLTYCLQNNKPLR